MEPINWSSPGSEYLLIRNEEKDVGIPIASPKWFSNDLFPFRKCLFINQNQMAYIGLLWLMLTGRFFCWLIWSNDIHRLRQEEFPLRLSIEATGAILPQMGQIDIH